MSGRRARSAISPLLRYRRQCTGPFVAAAWAQSAIGAPPVFPELAMENPAPGIYVHYGEQAEMTPANFGDVANLGFVVGARCVAVIDTGGTFAVGRALRLAIRRVTSVPVCYVINTHVHPDHVFGNAAFVDDHPEFIGHARLADAIAIARPELPQRIATGLGDVALQSEIVLPTRSVKSTEALDLGGRVLRLRSWPTAHTDTDLTVFDQENQNDMARVICCLSGMCPLSTATCAVFWPRWKNSIRSKPDSRWFLGMAAPSTWPGALAPE